MPKKIVMQAGWRGWLWCLNAYLRLWHVSLALRFLGFDWLRPQLEINRSSSEPLDNQPPTGSQSFTGKLPIMLHEAIRLAGRVHVMKPACLPKSLVLVKMLRARGVKAKAVLGVTKEGQGLASHAWVEVLQGEQWIMVAEPETVSSEFSRV